MRIAYLCQTYPPMITGVSLALERLAEDMRARGHTVLVIAASESGEFSKQESERLRLVRLHSYNNPMGSNQRFMPWPKSKIEDELDNFSPDVFHIHDPLLAGIGGVSYGKDKNVPVLLTLHLQPQAVSVHFPGLPGLRRSVEAVSREYGKRILRQCATVIAPSKTIADLIHQVVGIQPRIISNGVDLEAFSPQPSGADEERALRQALGLGPEAPIILFVGRLSKEKKIEKVLRLSAKVMKRCEAQLLVVGDGPQKEELVELSERLGIRERSRFPGFVRPEKALPTVYRLARVFLMTSEIEAQGKTTLEALASGLPVLAVRSPAAEELVQDGISGYLIEAGDEEDMAERLLELISDAQRADQMGRAGRDFAEAEHSYANSLDAHEGLYQELVGEKEKG